MGRGETAFLLQEMEKSTLLSERSWLGREGSEVQVFQGFRNPLFLAKSGSGRARAGAGGTLNRGPGSHLLELSSVLGLGDHLLMLPAIEENGLSSTPLSQGFS